MWLRKWHLIFRINKLKYWNGWTQNMHELSRATIEHPGEVLGSESFDKLVQIFQWKPLWGVRLCYALYEIKVLGKRATSEHPEEVLGS